MSIGTVIADTIIRRAKLTPYFHLRGYMGRWWLMRIGKRNEDGSPSLLGARVHNIVRSDDDRACHCHPWPYLAIILKGGYWEVREFPMNTRREIKRALRYGERSGATVTFPQNGDHPKVMWVKRWHGPGSILFRHSTDRHRLILPTCLPDEPIYDKSVWTLFFTGPKRKSWFFYTDNGPVNWRDYPPAIEDNINDQQMKWPA